MGTLKTFTVVAQVAEHLREELRRGRWKERMPGRDHLAAELGVSPRSVQGALELLEKEGLLEKQGVGRQRRILQEVDSNPVGMRVVILLYEKASRKIDYLVELRHQLEEAGHRTTFANKTLQDLGMSPERVARFVRQTPADAWVVVSASREVLEWFSGQPVPAFALFGRLVSTPLAGAGPRKSAAVADAVRRLVELGHRRIVVLCREERRKPQPGFVERVFLQELEAHGITTGAYNLPDWGNTLEEFHTGLDALFRISPPTALLCSYPALFFAAESHLAQRGIVAPRDISMMCMDPDPAFDWCEPSVSHISWDSSQVVRRVMRWVGNVARGRDDRRNTPTPARFVEGGTVGPVPVRARP
jgi:DNA-binding LacI/PurR family transcriptional regulator